MVTTESGFCSRSLALGMALFLTGCGTQSSSRSSHNQVSVQLSPTSVTLQSDATQQFTYVVQGTNNTTVTFSVDSIPGGNSTVGTITAGGLYTAPSPSGTHTVMATSSADTSASATAAVTVQGLVSLSPGTASLNAGATQQFTATVSGQTSPAITWTVDGISGGNSSVGTISAQGLYKAPSQTGNHTVGASITSPAASATAAVTIFDMSLSPGNALLAPSATQQFAANVQGFSNTSVTWSVDGAAGGSAAAGTITSNGLYTAPGSIGAHTVTATSVANTSASVSGAVTVVNIAQSAVLTYHNDDARDGAYTQEVTLMPSNVNSSQFGKVLSYPVDGQIYGQPLYMPQVNINGGTHDVVFVATQNNSVYAFDADATSGHSTTFWQRNFGAPVYSGDVWGPYPIVGVLSTPVIDATTNTIYVVSHQSGVATEYWLHAMDVTTGKDKTNPVGITGSFSGDSLGNGCYQRMGLALNPVTNWVYVAFGSCPHGWVFAYDKTSLAQTGIFESTNGAAGGGFWSSGAAPAIDDSNGDIYLLSGVDSGDEQWINGSSMVGYNDAFLRLDPGKLTVLDYFAPDDNYTLAVNDVDLGSGGNILLPGSSTYPHIVLGGGKDGNIFVVNRDSMGGFNDTSNNVLQTVLTGQTQYDNIFSTPVYWNANLYYHCTRDVLRAFSWNAGAAAGQQLSSSPTSVGQINFSGNAAHGATASLSANGNNNGIVWEIDNSAYNSTDPSTSGAAVLYAYDATNVGTELYSSAQSGSRDQAGLAVKFTVPTVANGRVFVPTATELDIYGLLSQ